MQTINKLSKSSLVNLLIMILYFTWIASFKFALLFVLMFLVHEYGHYFVAKFFKVKNLTHVQFNFPIGAAINYQRNSIPLYKDIIVSLSGPGAGLVSTILCIVLYHFTGNLTVLGFGIASLWFNLFNLLPILPLDGGSVIQNLFFTSKKLFKVFIYIGLVLSASVIYFTTAGGIILLFLSLVMLFINFKPTEKIDLKAKLVLFAAYLMLVGVSVGIIYQYNNVMDYHHSLAALK
jgi:Zn-dependent protease